MPRLLAGLVLTVTLGLAWGGSRPFHAADSDTVLTLRCRKAIAADPQLANLPLSIDVVNRVAIVGGPVPSLELVDRVRAALAEVRELETAKVTCWVPARPDPLGDRVGELLRGDTRARPEPPVMAMVPRLAPVPEPPPPRNDPPPVTVASTVTRSAERGLLGEPVVPAGHQFEARVRRLRQSDTRFEGLQTDYAAGVVTVTGRVTDATAIWEFVGVVRTLPGVTRVKIGQVALD